LEKQRENAARAKSETAARRAIFAAIVEKRKWQAPSMRVMAELCADFIDYDAGEALMDALGIPESKGLGFVGRISQHVKRLKTEAECEAFVAQCYLAEELHVNSYAMSPKAPRLAEAAKRAGVDVAAIRRELAPKKESKKKKKKKSAKSKAAKNSKAKQ
jgi:hypothetical protein